MTLKSPPTTRPELLGKKIVEIHDPYPHGDGLIPPRASLYEIVVAEEDYVAMRELGNLEWLRGPESFRPIMRMWFGLDELEPGEKLDTFLTGASVIFGIPDFVYFRGQTREKWEREHGPGPGS